MKSKLTITLIMSFVFHFAKAQESIIVDGQAVLDTDASYIHIGDLGGGDGLRKLVLRSWDQDRIWVDDYGRVGIGKANPGGALDVNGNILLSATSNPTLDFTSSDNAIINRTSGRELHFAEGYNSTQLVIKAGGTIGIGTTTPNGSSKLDVYGGIAVNGQVSLNSNSTKIWCGDLAGGDGMRVLSLVSWDKERMLFNNDGNYDVLDGGFRLNRITTPLTGGSISGQIYQLQNLVGTADGLVYQADHHQFRNYDGTPEVTIKDGNVGIATTNPDPAYKLSVNGSIRSKEVKVEAGWSDFVFDEGYNLRSLKEVESFIHEKGHLPEIPSEAEVTENGINLGEMNAKLLQKIEELTLYLIEKDKQIEDQNARIQKLTERVESLEN